VPKSIDRDGNSICHLNGGASKRTAGTRSQPENRPAAATSSEWNLNSNEINQSVVGSGAGHSARKTGTPNSGFGPETDTSKPDRVSVRRVILLAFPLGLAIFITLHRVAIGELGPAGLYGDEKIHACSSLFLMSLLHDLPLSHPVTYAYHYYAQYPALGIVQYPPFFYLTEGLIFLVFGPSVVMARLTVLLFTLVAAYFWFQLVKDLANEWAAYISTALLLCLPGLLPFEKSVMLEIPTLSLCIAASYFWVRYLRERHSRLLYTFAVIASLALLTKQNAFYLPVFCLLSSLALRRWKLLLTRNSVYAFLIVCALAGPAYIIEIVVQWHSLRVDMNYASPVVHKLPLWQWLFYPSTLPATLGWPLLILALAGILSSGWRSDRESTAIMLSWIGACWLTMGLIPHQEARYVCYWLPPFVYFAARLPILATAKKQLRPAVAVLAAVILAFYVSKAWNYQRDFVSGYAAVARQITGSGYHGIVLTDMQLAANFIFFVRKDDPGRHIAVMRKGLFVTRYFPQMGYKVMVDSRQQILSLISKYGIRYIVVEKEMPIEFEVQRQLRELLMNPRFHEVGTFPIRSNEPQWQGRSLCIYEDTQAKPPTAKIYRLKMLTMSHNIDVPMAQLFKK
jgi:Dolichyl-phosphate-mannose-protein mannosyltransferase